MPSSTNTRHSAMPSSCHMIPTDAKKPGFSRLPHDTTFYLAVTLATHRAARVADQGLDFSR